MIYCQAPVLPLKQAKYEQVKKLWSDQYARVPKHVGMLALFHPVIDLVEF
jgi:hypothetical protein